MRNWIARAISTPESTARNMAPTRLPVFQAATAKTVKKTPPKSMKIARTLDLKLPPRDGGGREARPRPQSLRFARAPGKPPGLTRPTPSRRLSRAGDGNGEPAAPTGNHHGTGEGASMSHPIVLGYDGSLCSTGALDEAVALAGELGHGEIVIVYCHEPPPGLSCELDPACAAAKELRDYERSSL